MGVPALFRWLSKKYPKIVEQVIEDTPIMNEVEGGYEEVPLDMSQRNPNGTEFDNLYLDMNGIVHPCTHPEGKKPPETEEEMMIEVFKYTERVVNMIRPRKLLMIAIDGVAPRAKMNQQRSRRFRAAQEAKTKEEEKLMAIEEWKSMGKEIPEEYKNSKKAWDSNAITPGTPFMKLLTESLRYWIVHKMNSDPGWKQIQVILSDASVPGEGEHKIMDFIRRLRTQPDYNPNTKHVIYGLDADLIMLSLATHEPHFKVLREDVFADEKKRKGCHVCGQPGHHSSQCQGKPKEKADEFDVKQKPVERKPFIFLDVSTLREYLAVELNIGGLTFPFDLERAIDDWVLLIFFVGNDFLPHLPSLEIREGAIDALLKIWKANLARMGGYLTDCGQLNLKRTEIILDGLASREDEIFRKRRETEERQDRDFKKRKIDEGGGRGSSGRSPPRSQYSLSNIKPGSSPASGLPNRPSFSPQTPDKVNGGPNAIPGLNVRSSPPVSVISMASNADIVKNRFAIRNANLDAAAMLKAELSGRLEVPSTSAIEPTENSLSEPSNPTVETPNVKENSDGQPAEESSAKLATSEVSQTGPSPGDENATVDPKVKSEVKADQGGTVEEGLKLEKDLNTTDGQISSPSHLLKRKAEEIEGEDPPDPNETFDSEVVLLSDEEEEDNEEAENVSVFIPGQPSKPAPLKMLGNNMVEQDDTVKLWEPGYRERYFRQKFGIELSDEVEKRKIVKCYVEGLAWVLSYYYQGCQSWQWYYPYHYSPFAADFTNLEEFEIKFDIGQPFRPYEQLMGVFPAASRCHLPSPYHDLMTSDSSPIKDFYPEEFEIDMNGKKMLWQGVALLPFIEQDRLLGCMKPLEDQLTAEDKHRNRDGDVVIFCCEGHPQYENFCKIYRKRDSTEPIELEPLAAKGVFGSALPDPNCIPGSTFYSPLTTIGLPDISDDKSLFARFYFPSQRVPHRSVLLKGVKLEKRVLNDHDRENTRSGRTPNSGYGGNSYGDGFHQQRRELGDGPSVISNFRTGNFHSGRTVGGGGNPNQYTYSAPPQRYPQQSHNGNYSNFQAQVGRGGQNPYSQYNGQANRGGYGNYGNGQNYSQAFVQNYSRQSNYGGNQHNPGGYRPPYSNQTVQGSYNGGRGNPYSAPSGGGGYGGTGIGLNQPSGGNHYGGYQPPNGSVSSRGGGYRQPAIVPAVTRTGTNPYRHNGQGGGGGQR